MRFIIFAVWFVLLEILSLISNTVSGSRIISFVLYMVSFYIIEMILIQITTKKHTVVITNKAEKVTRGLFGGTLKHGVVKTSDGDIFECVNYWPFLRDAKAKFAKVKVGRKYQITTCWPLSIKPVRWIKSVSEIKTTKRKVVKK